MLGTAGPGKDTAYCYKPKQIFRYVKGQPLVELSHSPANQEMCLHSLKNGAYAHGGRKHAARRWKEPCAAQATNSS